MLKLIIAVLLGALILFFHPYFLKIAGQFLILESKFKTCDAAVVLNSGVDIYPRLIQGAALYNDGQAAKVVINGNRKNKAFRELEKQGYRRPNPWFEEHLSILNFLGVPSKDIIIVDGEDAFDTVTEARRVGKELLKRGVKSIAVTTCRYHSRRAFNVYQALYGKYLKIYSAPARKDVFDPQRWWKKPKQVRWVMQEYGGWIFSVFNRLTKNPS